MAVALRKLTKRQSAVMEAIDRRQPIKVIASDLGVSESRINQHIKTLKDIYGAASLPELVELYRVIRGTQNRLHSSAVICKTLIEILL